MSPEVNPSGRTFVSAQEQQLMRERALAEARARLVAQETRSSSTPTPVSERRKSSSPPVRQTPATLAPNPTASPARRVTRSNPVDSDSHGALMQHELQSGVRFDPRNNEPEVIERVSRKKSLRNRTFALGAIATLGAGGWFMWDNDLLDKVTPASIMPNATGEVSDEIVLPSVAGAEGFNMQNCMRDGAEIASLKITTGHYAMRYLLQLGEDPAPRVQPPYVTEENMGEHQEFVTDSGYPEMTVHNIVMQIYACQKDGASAVDSTAEGVTINKNNLDFVAKPLLPEGNQGITQTEAYMTDLEDGVIFTYPRDWLPVVDPANTEALQPVRDVHFTDPQRLGVFNTALQTAIAGASTASESDFFENVDFIGTPGRTLYSAIDEGLKQRLGSDNVTLAGAVSTITTQDAATDAKATLIDTTGDPEDSFTLVEGEVIVGHYKTDGVKK